MKAKKTKKLIKQLKPYWKEVRKLESKFYKQLYKLQDKMRKETNIKGLEFFYCDGENVGIGNESRDMELIYDHELIEDE